MISVVKSSAEMALGQTPLIPVPMDIGEINMLDGDEYQRVRSAMMKVDSFRYLLARVILISNR